VDLKGLHQEILRFLSNLKVLRDRNGHRVHVVDQLDVVAAGPRSDSEEHLIENDALERILRFIYSFFLLLLFLCLFPYICWRGGFFKLLFGLCKKYIYNSFDFDLS
jgi:hypothetical protein